MLESKIEHLGGAIRQRSLPRGRLHFSGHSAGSFKAKNSGVWGGAPGETAGLASTFWEKSQKGKMGLSGKTDSAGGHWVRECLSFLCVLLV